MESQLSSTSALPNLTMNGEVDLSIILVCWNNKNYLEPCLQSLYDGGLPLRFDVVVVDNGSTDGSQQMLCDRFPQVKIIQNDHNVGLSRACNQGILATHSRHVLLLNNDTLVNGPSLSAMAQFLDENPTAGAVGGKLLNADGSFQAGYANFSSLNEEILIATHLGELFWNGYPSHIDVTAVKSVDWLSSACLMLRRAALDQVGLLDEQYFIYGDETDLQYRLKRAGWCIYYLPSAITIHYGGRSMDRWRRRKMVYRGKMLFYQKNYGWLASLALRAIIAMLSIAKLFGWGAAVALPSMRKRAALELRSNIDVLKLCWKLA